MCEQCCANGRWNAFKKFCKYYYVFTPSIVLTISYLWAMIWVFIHYGQLQGIATLIITIIPYLIFLFCFLVVMSPPEEGWHKED
jgi:SNF family Na+-dependent transporter